MTGSNTNSTETRPVRPRDGRPDHFDLRLCISASESASGVAALSNAMQLNLEGSNLNMLSEL